MGSGWLKMGSNGLKRDRVLVAGYFVCFFLMGCCGFGWMEMDRPLVAGCQWVKKKCRVLFLQTNLGVDFDGAQPQLLVLVEHSATGTLVQFAVGFDADILFAGAQHLRWFRFSSSSLFSSRSSGIFWIFVFFFFFFWSRPRAIVFCFGFFFTQNLADVDNVTVRFGSRESNEEFVCLFVFWKFLCKFFFCPFLLFVGRALANGRRHFMADALRFSKNRTKKNETKTPKKKNRPAPNKKKRKRTEKRNER